MNYEKNDKRAFIFKDLGVNRDYQEIWDYQEKLLSESVAIKIRNKQKERLGQLDFETTANFLLLLEHPHVYTLGKSGHIENMLLNDDKLKHLGAKFINTNRGGDITYHGPGQIVGYPILDLENFSPDIHLYMRNLEEVIIRTLSEYGLNGERSKGESGVWFDVGTPSARKLCAMGVKASRWITMPGFALNVNTDMQYFDYIIPCGIKDKTVTSLEYELKKKIDMDEVKNLIKKHFQVVFQTD